jgi:putative ABC transport system permease protein
MWQVSVTRLWNTYSPVEMWEYHFMGRTLAELYWKGKPMGWLFATFSGFAILIACIGLFVRTSFTVVMRTREVAIRKILGASTTRALKLLLTDFLLLTVIAIVVAIP